MVKEFGDAPLSPGSRVPGFARIEMRRIEMLIF